MIRVLVKSSSATVRAGLEQLLASEPGLRLLREAVGDTTDGEFADEEQPDVIIAEVEGPDVDTEWSDLQDLSGEGTALLLLVDDPSSFPWTDVVGLGAKGILPKRISREELAAAVHAVAAGLVVLHPESTPPVLPGRPPRAGRQGSLIEPLTPREKEVLMIMAEGGSNKDISSRLSISEHTAKFHVSSIISKLGATSRTEAVTLAIRQGIIMV